MDKAVEADIVERLRCAAQFASHHVTLGGEAIEVKANPERNPLLDDAADVIERLTAALARAKAGEGRPTREQIARAICCGELRDCEPLGENTAACIALKGHHDKTIAAILALLPSPQPQAPLTDVLKALIEWFDKSNDESDDCGYMNGDSNKYPGNGELDIERIAEQARALIAAPPLVGVQRREEVARAAYEAFVAYHRVKPNDMIGVFCRSWERISDLPDSARENVRGAWFAIADALALPPHTGQPQEGVNAVGKERK